MQTTVQVNNENFIQKLSDSMLAFKGNKETTVMNSCTIYSNIMTNVYKAFGEEICLARHEEISSSVSRNLKAYIVK